MITGCNCTGLPYDTPTKIRSSSVASTSNGQSSFPQAYNYSASIEESRGRPEEPCKDYLIQSWSVPLRYSSPFPLELELNIPVRILCLENFGVQFEITVGIYDKVASQGLSTAHAQQWKESGQHSSAFSHSFCNLLLGPCANLIMQVYFQQARLERQHRKRYVLKSN